MVPPTWASRACSACCTGSGGYARSANLAASPSRRSRRVRDAELVPGKRRPAIRPPGLGGRALRRAGRTEEAQAWRDHAEACYDELLARHPEAFADHAAEFWITIGGDPSRALLLARENLALRPTARARELVHRASGDPRG